APTPTNTSGASSIPSIPRFVDPPGPASSIFTILPCQSTSVFPFNVISDPRTCFPGTAVSDPTLNACTTGDLPRISISSTGTTNFTPIYTVTPDRGVTLGTAQIGGPTPLNGFISVNTNG